MDDGEADVGIGIRLVQGLRLLHSFVCWMLSTWGFVWRRCMGACSKASSETASWWHQGDQCVVFSGLDSHAIVKPLECSVLPWWPPVCRVRQIKILHDQKSFIHSEIHDRQLMTSGSGFSVSVKCATLCLDEYWNKPNPEEELQAVLAACSILKCQCFHSSQQPFDPD